MRLNALATSTVGVYVLFVASIPTVGAQKMDRACDLPHGLQLEIATKYSRATVVRLSDLDEDDRRFFQKDHGDACPGLVKVDFTGDGKPTLALVLITKDGVKQKAELVLAHKVGEAWTIRVLETVDAVTVPVVWSQPPGEYRDVHGKKHIRAVMPVVIFARYEAWAILYSWTGSEVIKIWLLD